MLIHLFLLLFMLSVVQAASSEKLLMILLDGFRWDYWNQDSIDLPGFKTIFANGVKVEKMMPEFPSVSLPNHYSLLTGLHPEDHGFVANDMYDVTTGKSFKAFDQSVTDKDKAFWYGEAEPLWITATKQGKKTWMFHWIGCDVTINHQKPTFCQPYNNTPTIKDLRTAIDTGLQLFKNLSAELVGIYVIKVDDSGHRYGPETPEVNSMILKVDAELKRMVEKITELRLDQEVNVMIFSDHGMTEISPSRVVNISDVINMKDIDVIINGYGSHVHIWPKKTQIQEVYNTFVSTNPIPHVSVYKREEIPEVWHYRRNKRISPILLVAELGWYIDTPNFGFYTYDTGPMRGGHGFNISLSDMAGIFTAMGPSFKKNVRVSQLRNIDLYQVMCNILNVDPRPHNGSWSNVKELVTTHSSAPIRDVASKITHVVAFIAIYFRQLLD